MPCAVLSEPGGADRHATRRSASSDGSRRIGVEAAAARLRALRGVIHDLLDRVGPERGNVLERPPCAKMLPGVAYDVVAQLRVRDELLKRVEPRIRVVPHKEPRLPVSD